MKMSPTISIGLVSTLWLVFVVAFAPTASGQIILLQDDFNDNSLDNTKWQTDTSLATWSRGPRVVAEEGGEIKFENRGYLFTKNQFDPSVCPLRITGKFTFDPPPPGRVDVFNIVTRSDAIATPDFANVDEGIAFGVVTNGLVFITKFFDDDGRGSNIVLASASVPINPGETFEFEAIDDGTNLSFTIKEVGGDGTTATITATDTTVFTANFVLFYNREKFFSNDLYRAFLDDVTIEVFDSDGFIEDALRDLDAEIDSLDLSLIDAKNDKAAAGRRNAMSNRANGAANAVNNGNILDAIDQLLSLLDKLDGDPTPPDWMVDSAEKDDIREEVELLIELLLLL